MANEPYYQINDAEAKLHISLKGNTKIGEGIASFSTLPGNAEHMISTKDKGLLTDIPGTCSKFCDGCFNGGCYAVRDAKLHHNATIPAWGENTLLLRAGRLWDELDAYLTLKNAKAIKALRAGQPLQEARKLARIKILRQHVSGEIESADDLRHWVALARKHPETVIYVYTKNFDALGEYLDAGEDFPENYVVNVSQWHGVADAFLAKYGWAKLNVFTYDDSKKKGCDLPQAEKDRLAALPHCPAVLPNGRHAKLPDGNDVTCTVCGRCTRKTGREVAVYAH